MRLKKRSLTLLLLALLTATALITGCFGDPENKGQFKVINQSSSATINGIYISPASQGTWGDNKLYGGEVAPGDNWYSGYHYEPGSYDLKATFSTGQAPVEQYNQSVTAGQTINWRIYDL